MNASPAVAGDEPATTVLVVIADSQW